MRAVALCVALLPGHLMRTAALYSADSIMITEWSSHRDQREGLHRRSLHAAHCRASAGRHRGEQHQGIEWRSEEARCLTREPRRAISCGDTAQFSTWADDSS
eukprot:570668-Prorocentrum_minimum.AAC.1